MGTRSPVHIAFTPRFVRSARARVPATHSGAADLTHSEAAVVQARFDLPQATLTAHSVDRPLDERASPRDTCRSRINGKHLPLTTTAVATRV
jgi:hypothetical protein